VTEAFGAVKLTIRLTIAGFSALAVKQNGLRRQFSSRLRGGDGGELNSATGFLRCLEKRPDWLLRL